MPSLSPRSPTEIDTHIGKRLKALRKERNFTQKALGDSIGLSFKQIRKYEQGANRISASTLYDLGIVLKVEPDYFFEELDALCSTQDVQYPSGTSALSEDAKKAMDMFQSIRDPNQQKALADLLTYLMDKQTS